jgi:MFS family permease
MTVGDSSSSPSSPSSTLSAVQLEDSPSAVPAVPPRTPLPKLQLFTLFSITICNSFAMSLIYPIVPFAVAFFLPDLSKAELGYRAGWLAAAFSLGQFCSSIPMSRLSDRFGRKPLFISGLCGTLVAITWFGLSRSFWMSFAARLAWGLLNANIGITKVAIAEVCDDSNSAVGLSVLGVADALGRLTGPFLGGSLIFPATKWPETFGATGFFADYPFVFPCAFGMLLCVVSIVAACFFKETLKRDPVDVQTSHEGAFDVPGVLRSSGGGGSVLKPARLARRRSLKERSMLWRLLRSRTSFVPVLLYTLLGMCAATLQEIWPLWVLLPLNEGGFDMGSSEVGLLLVVGSPMQLIGQLFIFPRLTRRFGYLAIFKFSTMFVGACALITPFCSGGGIAESTPATWVVVSLLWSSISTVWMFSFTSVFALINNGCRRRERAALNGIGQSAVAVGRTLGPLAGGVIFAWSASGAHSFPFGYHFTFFLVGILFVVAGGLAFLLPPSINVRMPEGDEATDADADHVELVPRGDNSKRDPLTGAEQSSDVH